ncbi:MAG: o-succinylbenzoate--CoA ligase [bacterium]|nr:o-succinylbenzoate--CoA ligase [bacterium]
MTNLGSGTLDVDDWRCPWLSRRASLSPRDPAIDWRGSTLRYAELAERVAGVVRALGRLGVERGDVVAVHLPNGLSIVELVHAGFAGDFVLHLINTRLREPEIEFQLRDSEARFFVHLAADARARAVRLDEGTARICVREASGVSELVLASEAPRSSATGSSIACSEALDLQATRFVLYTSGTSGKPKGVALSAANLLASARGSAALLRAGRTDRWLLCLPIFHVGGLSILLRSVLAGSAVVLHERFLPDEINRALDHEGVTGISLVANMLSRILDQRSTDLPPRSLACVLLGGGPAPAALLDAAREAGFPVAPTYGLTEAASQVATRLPTDPEGSGLRPLEGTEVMIADESGCAVAPGHAGEIRVRGGSVMSDYWKRPEATRAALRDGWLRTGDIGSLDRAGRLTVYDRRSDLIVSGGENVYPAEVEAVLLEHPAIAEAGVAGQAHETFGQRPVAWLVSTVDDFRDSEDLHEHCRMRLAAYKCPVKFHWVASLPRTASGKLLRRELGRSGDEALEQ